MNCVGIVIMQMVDHYHVSMLSASWLEAFKDGTIVIGTFLLASLIPKMGYKKSFITGISLEVIGCCLMAIYPSFITARIFFMMIGAAFALIKISTYSSISLITNNDNEHAAFLSLLEGFFMGGILIVFALFSFFMKFTFWSNTYWFLAAISAIGLFMLLLSPYDEKNLLANSTREHTKEHAGFITMMRLFTKYIIWLFIILGFAYVFIEQGLTTWLPTYEEHVLHIAKVSSVELAGLFAGGLVIGRILGGIFIKHFNWRNVLIFCIIFALAVLLYTIKLSYHAAASNHHHIHAWQNIPLAAYLIPLVGVAIGSIYPILCSSILSSQPLEIQSSVSSLIVIVSALGGTIGSRIVGTLFGLFGGLTAIKVPVLPLIIILILLFPYYNRLQKLKRHNK